MATTSEELCARWDAAARRDVLRSTLDGAQWRVLPGSLGLLVLFNAQHRVAKRPVATDLQHSATQQAPAATKSFHFGKAHPSEFLCGLRVNETVAGGLAVHDVGSSDAWQPPHHAVLVNVSPLMRGHLLCVFDLPALRPQRLTLDMLRLALGVGQLMARDDFYLGFNSAGAWSSVNHCHFQGYWMDEVVRALGHASPGRFPVAIQERQLLHTTTSSGAAVQISRVKNWPMGCIAIEFVNDEATTTARQNACLASVVWGFVQHLQQTHVPHNLLISWHPSLVGFVFPRKLQQENGVGRFSAEQQLRFAVAEVAGLIVAGSETGFREISQEIYEEIMRNEVALEEATLSGLLEAVKQIVT